METTNKSNFEKLSQSIKKSVTLKLISIFILTMLLMIPMSMVKDLISERENLQQHAISEVSDKWANEQYVYGPILTIPLEKEILEATDGEEGKEKVKILHSNLHILPSQLTINGEVAPKSLNRGIYEVVVYDSKLAFNGSFDEIDKALANLNGYKARTEEAFLTINISDLRGIKEEIIVKWNDTNQHVEPGSQIQSFIPAGITVNNLLGSEGPFSGDFSFDLQLQGSQYLGFIPLGKETKVHLTSDWKDPGFSGSFLPKDRNITDAGFTADWQVLELNRNFPQSWIGERNINEVKNASFGVGLLLPSNDYQKSMRSAKYALLAISLTFLTFFLVEIFNKSKVHPFQYILIGLALCLFYTLLVSISEHANFNIAYLISSIAIIGMIGLYARAILQNTRQTLVLVAILGFTYTFVYVTMQIQDFALLIGSIGLTSILAFTMYITRNVNWYELSASKENTPPVDAQLQ